MSTSAKAASPEKEQQHKEHATHHDYSQVHHVALLLPSSSAELPLTRRFLTKETAAIHTMHEARGWPTTTVPQQC